MRTFDTAMPNGRPGDHPYTDIVTHGMDVPNEDVSEVVREIADSDNGSAKREARRLLWNAGVSSMSDDELPDEKLERLEGALSSLAVEVGRSEEYPEESPLDACLADVDAVYSAPVRRLVRDVHGEIEADVENDWWVHRALNGILWEFGWEPDRLDELEDRLRSFRDETVREQ